MKDFVSVIIPNYNHSRFLEERIQSVLGQTYQDFELIILDDCSQDGGASREVIEQYRHDPRVTHIVYNEVNSGSPFRQWHKGIELAKGEYVWIAESDDSCEETLLEKLVEQMQKYQAVMAFCRSVRYDENGEKCHYDWQDELSDDFVIDGRIFIKNFLMMTNRVANASGVLFRRDAALGIDTFYTQMKGEGDWLFWIQLAECGKVCFLGEELNYFRFHETNTTKRSVSSGIGIKEHMATYNYLVKKGLLSGKMKLKARMSKTHFATTLPLHSSTMAEVMHLWDPYHFYRTLYWLVRLKVKLTSLLRL